MKEALSPPAIWRVWLPLWRRREGMRGWSLQLWLMLVMLVVCAGSYQMTVQFNALRGVTVWDPSLPLDYRIPVLDWSIVPYLSLYLYAPLTAAIMPRRDDARRHLILLCQGLLIITAISNVIFILAPCEVYVIRQVSEAPGQLREPFAALFRLAHRLDREYNAWPSMHISITLLVVLFSVHSKWWAQPAKIALWIAWILLAMSVLTTKQHYVFDLLTGAVLAVVVWRSYLRPKLRAGTEGPDTT